jgi:hypothetical protein
MEGIGTVIPGFAGLSVRLPGQHWNFRLRRADFMADASFGTLHNAPVGAAIVAGYLPNWASLDWMRIPENLLTRAESLAQDLPYQVNVLASFSSSLTHDEVVQAFLLFMTRSMA